MVKSHTNEETPRRKPRLGIYLLPNLLTSAAMFSGFYAILAAIHDRFEPAAIAIFVAIVLDGMDGRIARLTNTQSDFGAEYDSLSDMVSFGLAPALVCYLWSLNQLGKLGWMAAFLYSMMAALRLARFNTQAGIADKRYFQGLPSPSAAGLVAGIVWVGADHGWTAGKPVALLAMLITCCAALLMVSRMRYFSFKEIDLRNKVSFMHVLVIALFFVLLSINPALLLFSGFVIFAASGPVYTLYNLRQRRALRRAQMRAAQVPEDVAK